jgi:conjugal transfer mating pair stabilization protein TraG
MYHQYGEGHTVIDSSGAISQLPFKASMTRGYASDLRNQGQWYMNEAERIENGTSATWSSSRGTFGSAVAASSEVSGSRSERGSRSSDTHNVGGNVMVEGSSGKSTREVTNDDLILRQGNSRSSGNFSTRTFGTSASLTGTGTIGTPLEGAIGSGVSASMSAALSGRKETGDNASANSERSATNQVTRGTDKSEDVGSRVVVSGNSGDVESSGTFSQNSEYTDASQSRTASEGTDWRIAEADERRAAAARYREIGGRMMSEASYAESHGFQVSSDMSNLIQDRYEALQREHPEWHIPDFSNPRLDYRDLARRDQAISYIMDDLMSDLRNRRIDELADVADIAGKGSIGSNAELGMPGSVALPPSGHTSALAASPLEGGTLLAAPDGPVDGARLARELGLGVKNGARLSRMDGDLVPAMGVVADEARELGLPKPVVTSGNDSTQHVAGSAHYANRALDFRGNNISDEQGEQWAERVQQRLGSSYAVDFERFPDNPARDHLHVAKRSS